MAINTFARSDANAVQLWSKLVEVETNKALAIRRLMGTSANSIIMIKDELTKGKGDKVSFNIRMQLSGAGQTEGGTLEGNEESYTIYQDNLVVNQLRHAVRVPAEGNISEQRVAFDIKSFGKDSLTDWYARRYTVSAFNQLCGYTTQTDTRYTGNNAVVAPSSGRIIRPASAAADETMTSDTYKFDIRMIDYAKEVAKTASPMMRPVMIDGEECYVLYMDPRQITDMRTNTSTGQWMDIVNSVQNGFGKDSDIVTGAIGKYNGVIIREAPDNVLPNGVNSSTGAAVSNTRRAVMLGAQAACCAWSKGGGPTTYNWREEEFDYGNEVGISANTLYGLKKTQFNSADYGTVVISTYAPSHTTTP